MWVVTQYTVRSKYTECMASFSVFLGLFEMPTTF